MAAAKKQKAIVHRKGEDFPQEIMELIEKSADGFMTAIEFCEKAKAKCIEYGIDPLEVGERVREILLKKGKSLRTIQRWLPAEFKAKPRGATVAGAIKAESKPLTENEEFSDKSGANQGVAEQNDQAIEDIRKDPAISQKLKDHLESLPENPNPPKPKPQQQETDSQKPAKENTKQQTAIDFSSTASMLRIIGGIDTDSYHKEYGSLLRDSLFQIIELNKTIAQLREQNAEYYRKNSGKSEATETVDPTKAKQSKRPKQQSKEDIPYEKTRNYALTVAVPMGVDSDDKWSRHVKSPDFPSDIPKRPDAYYLKRGQWKENGGWFGFLGKSNPKAKGEAAIVGVQA